VNAEQELQELVDERVRAVQMKDVTAIRARPADDVTTFEVIPPLNSSGSSDAVEHMQKWFDGYDGPIDFRRTMSASVARGTSASAHFSTTWVGR
jgi:ketosteroid isomerase-like protein